MEHCREETDGRSDHIQQEERVRTTAKGLREVFEAMPYSRIALEIGTHSPWISRLSSELGHEVIVANARKVRLIGESRKKEDRVCRRKEPGAPYEPRIPLTPTGLLMEGDYT